MAGPEQRGMIEAGVHYLNYADVALIGVGLATGNVGAALWGVAGLAGGNVVERKLRERREQGKFVI